MTAMTWILPAGEFTRELKEVAVGTREVIVNGSYSEVMQSPVSFLEVFSYPLKGFVSAAEIIGFILLAGGVFSIINSTGAINAGLFVLLEKTETSRILKKMVIPLLMFAFSICGATFGMAEEVLIFAMITIPMAERMGYDNITGLAIPFIGAGVGFAAAFFNPFTVQIAQGIADVKLLSGMNLRIFIWLLFTTVSIIFVVRYANKVMSKKQSEKKEVEDEDEELNDVFQLPDEASFDNISSISKRQIAVLVLFFASIVLLIVGAVKWDWYIQEISALFLGLGVLTALIAKMDLDESVRSFVTGLKDLLHPAILVGFAKAILLIAQDGKIIDTMLYAVSTSAVNLPTWLSTNVMFIVQSGINFLVPSGSGQAALTMPIMAPLADVLEIKRQTAVLAYQFGDGLSNFIIPTSGTTMGLLSLSGISYKEWLKWIMPLFIIMNLMALIILSLTETFDFWSVFGG
ncbi:MAG: YfcC family protein [Candidatus Kapaibacteriales bacterium]